MAEEREAILLRTSERSSFKRCRWRWHWSYVEHLKPEVAAPALRFGTLVHKALEKRYKPGRKRGPHPAGVFEKLYAKELEEASAFGFRDEDGTWADAAELGVAMMNNFVDTYGTDEEYEVISSEQTFRTPVFDGKGRYVCDYVGTFDGVWRHLPTKKILLKDWKTAATINTTHLPLDEQSGSYWTFGPEWLLDQGILRPQQKLSYILFTFLRKAKPDPRPTNSLGQCLNQDGTVSKKQPPPFFQREIVYRDDGDRANLRARVIEEAREMRLVRRGKLAVYKNPGPFTCMGCGLRDMCEVHETGGDWEAIRNATLVHSDPYEDHLDPHD